MHVSSISLCAQSCKENTVLCDDKFATSIKRETLAVGNENQSGEITFLLQLICSSDENSLGTKISFWCWKTQWQHNLKLLRCFVVDSSNLVAMSVKTCRKSCRGVLWIHSREFTWEQDPTIYLASSHGPSPASSGVYMPLELTSTWGFQNNISRILYVAQSTFECVLTTR